MNSPLARLGAIKLKVGALLVGSILLTIVVLLGGAQLGVPTWINALVAVGVGLLAVDLLGSGLTAPLRQMARQADRLAAGHPVDAVDDTARDEVGDLARAFNRMAVEVAHTDRVRRELVANVSHELRTPLAALGATLENLVDGLEEAGPTQLARMEGQVGRLRALVEQLLDLSQLDAGAIELDRRPTDIAGLVAEAVASCDPTASDRVVVVGADAVGLVAVDPDRAGQALVNLLDNALRHGPDGTPVTVTAVIDAGRLRLTVEDEGPGIPPEQAAHVFERFARTDAGRATATGGAGLGLAITRWVAELHGGTVLVDRPEQPGARLTMELPMTEPFATTEAGSVLDAPGTAVPSETTSGSPADSLRLLPTPIGGFPARTLLAMAGAAAVAILLGGAPFRDGPGLGLTVLLLAGAGAAVVGLERRLDAFGVACCSIAALVAVQWWVSDATWALVPLTLGAILLAGLGIWGPHRFGEVARALVVGPLLVLAVPLATVRGMRSQRRASVARVLVPAVATLLVLLVFGGLLTGADAVFARAIDAIVPDVNLDIALVPRVLLGVLAAAFVATYALAQRAGTVPATAWERPVRPLTDWLVPLVALVVLVGAFVLLQLGVLFGGSERVLETAGLTYAEYAREGFGQLLLTALLTLGVIATVVRVADDAHRRVRDRLLGALVVLTFVVLASSVQRLVLYADAFGFTRLRVTAFAVLGWIAALLVLVVAAGLVRRFAPLLPRTVVLTTAVLALAFVAARPDVIVASRNVARFEADGSIDVDYLQWLSADAVPVLATLPEDVRDHVLWAYDGGYCDGPDTVRHSSWTGRNFARDRAHEVRRELAGC